MSKNNTNTNTNTNTNAIATTNATTTKNVVALFVANEKNASSMSNEMRANVNARADANERKTIVALYETMRTLQRDETTNHDNECKTIRRTLRSMNFHISAFTRNASNAIVANALKSYDAKHANA